MTKARRDMEEGIKLIDLIIELLDARAPFSSLNPDIGKMSNGRGRLLILNKADLADPEKTKEWIKHFKSKGLYAVAMDSRTKKDLRFVNSAVREACKEKLESNKKKGIKNRPLRAMVAGIPNAGKSTFINTYGGRSTTKTGNKPGVTRGKQWIRLSKELELLDTPGILWPKIEDQEVGLKLAILGTLNDNVVNKEEMAISLLLILRDEFGIDLSSFGIEKDTQKDRLLLDAAVAKNTLKKGGESDTERVAGLILGDFRSGKFGRITLESPQNIEDI